MEGMPRGEKRELMRRKARYGPRGGTRAAQLARIRTARGYRGHAKKFVRRKAKEIVMK